MDVWIIPGDTLHDGSLSKTDADDQVIAALSKRAHGRLNRSRITGLDIAENNIQRRLATASLAIRQGPRFSAFHAGPRRRIERAIVFAADVKNNAHMNFRFVVRAVTRVVARRTDEDQ